MKTIFYLICIGLFFSFIIVMVIDEGVFKPIQIRESCEDIYMEYYHMGRTIYCLDNFNNAHYVKFNCEGFLWTKECEAQLISVGDVRTKGVDLD